MFALCLALRAQTIFYFRRTCFFGNAAHPKGGYGRAALPFEWSETKRRIDGSKEFVLHSEVFLYVCTMPCPSSETRVAESGEVVRQHLLKKVCNVRTYP